MTICRNLRSILLPLLVTAAVVAAGCAKEPSPDASTAAPPAAPAPAVSTPQEVTPAPSQGFQEERIVDSATTSAPATTTMQSAEAQLAALTRINFDYDQYVLSTTARDTLAANAAILKALPTVKIKVEGHCDERGSDQYNIALGERRAQAALNYLVSLGVDPGQLSTVSFGEEMPLVPGHDETAWAQNRRAEFKPVK